MMRSVSIKNKKGFFVITLTFLLILFTNFNSVFGQTSTESGDSIREKVREKIEQVKSKPKALIGTVTDKTEDTIEIKERTGEIQLISVSPSEVSFVKIGTKSVNVKFSDVAIGDFIVAMGFYNGNSVLSARRVLLTKPPEEPTRDINSGIIQKIDKKIVTIKDKDNNEIYLEFGKRWKGPELKELNTGDLITAVGETDSDKIKVRSVFVAKRTETSPTPKAKE